MPQSAKKSKAQLVYLLSDVNIAPNDSTSNSRQFSGIANSGKPFDCYGIQTVIDLADIQYHDTVPALLEHERSKRAGFGKLSVENNQLVIKGTLLDNEFGNQIAEDADAGFPWQMSAHVIAGQTDELRQGSATVNGQTVNAPILILRQCRIPEVSFTPTGVDDQTSAVVLGDDGKTTGNYLSDLKKDNSMNLQEALAEIETLKAKDAEKDQKIADLTAENDKLKASETKAQVDAQLSQAGFARSDDGKWQGVSDTTYQVLLSQTADNTKAMIGDLKLSQSNQPATPAKPNLPNVLLGEQYPNGQQNQGQGVKLSDNPLIANAQARANQAKTYI